MTCQLCEEDKPLIKAHIYPRGFYADLKNQKGQVFGLQGGSNPKKILQSGVWDDKILCANCDNQIIGKWDKYGIEFFRGATQWRKVNFPPHQEAYYAVNNWCYPTLKLFLLSILWRMSASSSFSVSLGKHGSLIREKLLASDPGSTDDYSVLLAKLRPPKNNPQGQRHKSLLGPYFQKDRGSLRNHYRFTLNDFSVVIKVDQRPFGEPLNELCLQSTTNQPLIIIEQPYEGSWEEKYFCSLRNVVRQISS